MPASEARLIWRLAAPHRGRAFLGVSLSLSAAGLGVVMPLALRELINKAIQRDSYHLWRISVLLLGLTLFRTVCRSRSLYLLQTVTEYVTCDLRSLVYTKLLSRRPGSSAYNVTGDISARLLNDVGSVCSVLSELCSSGIYNVIQLLGCACVLLALDKQLGLIVLLLMPAGVFVVKAMEPSLRATSREYQEAAARSNAIATEMLSNMRTVKAFVQEVRELHRYENAMTTAKAATNRLASVLCRNAIVTDMLFGTATVIVFAYGGFRLIAGNIHTGDLVATLFYAEKVAQSVSD
jgi:ABC-type multidrug transport system fused ATPase/permease subunit